MRSIILCTVTALALVGAGCASRAPEPPAAASAATAPGAIPESRIGIRRTDVSEASPVEPVAQVTADPGEAALPAVPFQGSPPVIPHSVDGLLPITARENACLGCHEPSAAGDSGATPIPASHFESGKLDHRRYLCIFCHVPQTEAKPLVENRFKP